MSVLKDCVRSARGALRCFVPGSFEWARELDGMLVGFVYGFWDTCSRSERISSVRAPLNRGVDSVKISRGDAPPLNSNSNQNST